MTAAKKPGKPALEFAGVSLDIPAKLPASFSFDLMLTTVDDEEAAGSAIANAILSVIGMEQYRKVRDSLSKKRSDTGGVKELGDLLQAITEAYGLETGE